MAKQLRSLWLGLAQQPAGLIACGVLHRRPVQVPLSAQKNTAHKVCCVFSAPPGTRTLGLLIKRNQRATIVNFQNCVNLCFVSAAFFAPIIPSCIRHPAVPVCKKCAKMCRAKISPLKQGSDFYAKLGKWAGLARKWHPQFHLFKPSIKCTSTITIHGRDLDNCDLL